MNTQLVDSLVQAIRSLSAEERSVLHLVSNDPQFPMTGLKVTSKVRVTRVVTLERRMLQRRLGRLSGQLMERLNQALRKAFQLTSDSEEAGNDE